MTQTLLSAAEQETPLQIIGTLNPYIALMAEQLGFRALYLSGAGVANNSFALPDLGLTTLDEVLEDARRITERVPLPLLVDIDTGWGGPLMIEKVIQRMERAGVAAVHIEDQVEQKRCGHRPGKQLVTTEQMVERIEAACQGRKNSDLQIMARTDAFANEEIERVQQRCLAYKQAGADMLFLEAFDHLEQYTAIKQATGLPILANMTEFGKTPLYSVEQLAEAKVDMVLYPLSCARAMNKAAQQTLQTIREQGTQKNILDSMQTRKELYKILDYHTFEDLCTKNQGEKKWEPLA